MSSSSSSSQSNEAKFIGIVAKALVGAVFGYVAYRSVKARAEQVAQRKAAKKSCGDSDAEDNHGCRRKKECGGRKHWGEPKKPKNLAVAGVARLPVFSSASVIGKTIYVSGTLGTVAVPTDGTPASGAAVLVQGGLRAEVKQTMDNIATILRGVMTRALPEGCALPPGFNVWGQVAKANVYLRDTGAEAFGVLNEEYAKYFVGVTHPPARMTSAGVSLALNAAVEIEVVAKLPYGVARSKGHGPHGPHGHHFGRFGGHPGFGAHHGHHGGHGHCGGGFIRKFFRGLFGGGHGHGCHGGPKPKRCQCGTRNDDNEEEERPRGGCGKAEADAAPAAAAGAGAGSAGAAAAKDEKQN